MFKKLIPNSVRWSIKPRSNLLTKGGGACCVASSPTFIMDKELIPSSSQNDCTGDHIITKPSSQAYRSGYDRIFNKSKADEPDAQEQSDQTCEDCPQPAEVEDLCNESTCAVRSGLLNRN